FCRRKLPEHRSELRLQLKHATREEPLDRLPGLGQHAPVGRVARAFEREDEVIGGFLGPAAKARGLLRAVERAVDLDRGEYAARVRQLARVRQALGIEHPPPGLVDPAADANSDHAEIRSSTRNASATCTPGRRAPAPRSGP